MRNKWPLGGVVGYVCDSKAVFIKSCMRSRNIHRGITQTSVENVSISALT